MKNSTNKAGVILEKEYKGFVARKNREEEHFSLYPDTHYSFEIFYKKHLLIKEYVKLSYFSDNYFWTMITYFLFTSYNSEFSKKMSMEEIEDVVNNLKLK